MGVPSTRANRYYRLIKNANAISRSWNRGGSGNEAPVLASPTDMLKFAPLAMFTALFRPLPGEVMNPFGMLAGIENLILLSLLILAIRRGRLSVLKDQTILWAVSFVIIWSFVYGFVSFQNMGAAVRFKLQILPLLISLILYLVYGDRLGRRRQLDNAEVLSV